MSRLANDDIVNNNTGGIIICLFSYLNGRQWKFLLIDKNVQECKLITETRNEIIEKEIKNYNDWKISNAKQNKIIQEFVQKKYYTLIKGIKKNHSNKIERIFEEVKLLLGV